MKIKTQPRFQWQLLLPPLILLLVSLIFRTTHGDVGTSAQYSPPYLPTECYASDSSQFPSSNLFAAAGDGIWDNGASCGRLYQVRCISAAVPGTCIPDKTILIKIVDYAGSLVSDPSAPGTTMVLSQTGFAAIANSTASSINIEFQHSTDGYETQNHEFNEKKPKPMEVILKNVGGSTVAVILLLVSCTCAVKLVIRRRSGTSEIQLAASMNTSSLARNIEEAI